MYPMGVPTEMVAADYAPHEMKLMGRLRSQVEQAEEGSPERAAALNSVHVLHELKALGEGDFLTDDEIRVMNAPPERERSTDSPRPICEHEGSVWEGMDGRIVCGLCHPPPVARMVLRWHEGGPDVRPVAEPVQPVAEPDKEGERLVRPF